jgi:hypothetical protein
MPNDSLNRRLSDSCAIGAYRCGPGRREPSQYPANSDHPDALFGHRRAGQILKVSMADGVFVSG